MHWFLRSLVIATCFTVGGLSGYGICEYKHHQESLPPPGCKRIEIVMDIPEEVWMMFSAGQKQQLQAMQDAAEELSAKTRKIRDEGQQPRIGLKNDYGRSEPH